MCLIVVAWQAHPEFPLVLAANRDEFFARPTAAADFWPDAPAILAGRDLAAGGTWLGLARAEDRSRATQWRLAALTNYRDPAQQRPDARSRGELTTAFLRADLGAFEHATALSKNCREYGGFNLLIASLGREGAGELAYCHNLAEALGQQAPASPQRLAPGIHAVSNSVLDTPWPKLQQARQQFAEALRLLPDSDAFNTAALALLADRQRAADADLPNTGVSLAWERVLSSIFVAAPDYGTRASTLLWIDRQGQASLLEVSFGPGGEEQQRRHFLLPPQP